ncbi:MAG: radical SAM protein [Planctomycetes bacterium]|nr:radical SAM protein [Planctomycetota bacterium]
MKGLMDNYGRRTNYLRISITDRCNFRCIYCMPPAGVPLLPKEEILSYEEILQVAKTALGLGITRFRITGGEPLIRSGIINFLENLIKTPAVEGVSLTTNGLLLKEYAADLHRLGINSVNVSLNSLKADTFARLSGVAAAPARRSLGAGGESRPERRGGVDGLKAVRSGIDALLNCGYRNIKINTVVMNGYNQDEVLDFARLTIDKPLAVRFIEYMPCGATAESRRLWRGGNWRSRNGAPTVASGQESPPGWTISARQLLDQINMLGRLEPVNRRMGQGPARYYQLAGAKGVIGFITAVSQPFCATCNRLRLTADGQLKACLLSTDTVDIKPILRTNGISLDKLQDAFVRTALLKPGVHHNEQLTQMSRVGG